MSLVGHPKMVVKSKGIFLKMPEQANRSVMVSMCFLPKDRQQNHDSTLAYVTVF